MTDEPPTTPPKPVTRLERKLVHTAMTIGDFAEDVNPEFLHAVLCQLGLPRSKVEGRNFSRGAGNATMMLTAGSRVINPLTNEWQDLPLPYGMHPRLVLQHLCSEAIRTQSPDIDVSDGIKPFLHRVGITVNGHSWKRFKEQMVYLASSSMVLGFGTSDGRVRQLRADPIREFEMWGDPFTGQAGLWPEQISLGREFFETLCEHAVPLDPRAIGALQHSSLALDTYTWLAHRLCRVRTPSGVKLSWGNLREQFGQEYNNPKDFKKAMKPAIRKVLAVYPKAKVTDETGGIRLYPSPPPIAKRNVLKFRSET